jgi:sulfatase maturation enzyme AslB (radical SAM superfamily)
METKTNLDQDIYCAAPFRHMVYKPRFGSQPCCQWSHDDNHQFGKPMAKDEPDPFNHAWMDSLRAAMLSNTPIKGCKECYQNEKIETWSGRIAFNERYGRPTDHSLVWLECDFGNLCNLKCRMCGSWNSSKWIGDEIALGKSATPLSRPDLTGITFDISKLDRLRYVGGEPALEQDAFKHLLRRIANDQHGLGNLEVVITTNCTVLFDAEMLSLLDQCKSIEMQCSVDGIGTINDYQRTGTDWSVLLENLLHYQAVLNHRYSLHMLTSWSLINCNTAIDYMETVINILPRYVHWGHLVYDPAYLAINNVPDDLKTVICDRLAAWVTHDESMVIMHNKNIIISQLRQPSNVTPAEVLASIARLDQLRDESFAEVNPEMHAALVSACENTNQA